MNRLWIRLSLAFGSVIVISLITTGIIIFLLNDPDTTNRFVLDNLQNRNGVIDSIERYYETNQTWDGIANLLSSIQQRLPAPRGAQLALMLLDENRNEIFDGTNIRQRNNSQGRRNQPNDNNRPRQELTTIPLQVNGTTRGFLQVLAPPDPNAEVDQQINELVSQQLIRLSLLVLIIGSGVSFIIAILLSRSLTSPLAQLANAAKAFGKRNFSYPVPKSSTHEIQAVSSSFQIMAQQIQRSEELRNNLVADVAHELRNPLSVLQGNLMAILDDVYPCNEEQIGKIYTQTRLLSHLVSDLHELAQAEAKQISLHKEAIDINHLSQGVVELFTPVAQEKFITLQTEFSPNSPSSKLDPERIKQVLHNLLSNALRHTPENGVVTLRTEQKNNQFVISIQDTGEGIPANHIGNIFERFYRVDGHRSRESGGTGLGLAIARAIIEAHDGTISVWSAGSGQGTTFTIQLPIS